LPGAESTPLAGSNMESEIVYEMGYREDEFGAVLRGPFSGEKSDFESEALASNHWQVRHKVSSFCVDITLSPQPDRELGMFRLPVLRVCFNFQHEADDARAQFFKRFHQYFHKGGG